MHTVGMVVKDKRVLQGEQTREALLRAARELFGAKGFAGTSLGDIVSKGGVTKGALYHHFTDKVALFRAVFEQVQREVSDAAVTEFLQPDPWQALVAGCLQWVDAHDDPTIRQIVLVDARGVLGWEAARAIETRFSTVALRGALRKAMHTGILTRRPLRPLSLMLTGSLTEACLYVAQSEDPSSARHDIGILITGLLQGLRAPTEAPTNATTARPAARRPAR
jgi:AcrR family transcriptional regulator